MPADRSNAPSQLSAFISYAKPDQDRAQAIAEGLEKRGIKCWIAPRDVKPGRSYGDEIIRGIEKSRDFILVLSRESNKSAFVAREVERATSKNKPIFTVRIDDVTPAPALELFISGTQWIDAFPGRLDAHVDRLASLLVEEEGAVTSVTVERGSTQRLSFWRSPALLGGVGAAALAVAAATFVLSPPVFSPPPGTDVAGSGAFLPETCKGLTGDMAIAACDRAIELGQIGGRELSSVYAIRGYHRAAKYDLAGALSDYSEAINLDPTSAVTFNNRGNIYRDSAKYDLALADYDRAIEIQPWPDPLASRGWIYQQKGDLAGARADYDKALSLNPASDLKTKLETALAGLDPSDPDFSACDSGSGSVAIEACDRAIAAGRFTGNKLSILYNDRGYLRMLAGSLDEGLADLNEAIRIDPYGPYAYWNRAEIYRHKGDLASAKADYERALSLGPREEHKPRIEAALGAVNNQIAKEADPSVITDPSVFGAAGEEVISDAVGVPIQAAPAAPAEVPEHEMAPVDGLTTPEPIDSSPQPDRM